MIYTSLAVLAMSASAALPPVGNLVHFHPHMTDSRLNVTIVNRNVGFRDVKVDGKVYTIPAGHSVTVKAPEGTMIFADNRGAHHKRGDLLLQLDGAHNGKSVAID